MDQAAESWSLADELRETGRLVLTELATNAVRACPGGRIDAWVELPGDGTVDIKVWDPDGGRGPKTTHAGLLDLNGRGLPIVHALADGRCGWYRTDPSGKVVWARYGGTV